MTSYFTFTMEPYIHDVGGVIVLLKQPYTVTSIDPVFLVGNRVHIVLDIARLGCSREGAVVPGSQDATLLFGTPKLYGEDCSLKSLNLPHQHTHTHTSPAICYYHIVIYILLNHGIGGNVIYTSQLCKWSNLKSNLHFDVSFFFSTINIVYP